MTALLLRGRVRPHRAKPIRGLSFRTLANQGNDYMKKVFMVLVLLAVLGSVTSCNMFRGAGQDIENVGESIEHAGH